MTLLLSLILGALAYIAVLLTKRLPKPPNRTIAISVRFDPKGASTMADLSLLVGQSSVGTVTPLMANGATNSTAVVSNVVWTLTDPALTVTPSADGTVVIAGVAATTADVTGTVSATVTDSDGVATTFSATFTVSVGAVVPPANRTTSIGVHFSIPVS